MPDYEGGWKSSAFPATLIVRHNTLKILFDYLRQCFDKQRRSIERFGAGEDNAMLFGLLTSADLDIVEDLQVIGQELHRGDQHMGMAGCLEFGHQVGEVGLEPLFGRVARALVAELPAIIGNTGQLSDSS